jgi:hypothetical protein
MIMNYNTLDVLVDDLWDCLHRLQEMIPEDDQESEVVSALKHAEHQLSVLLGEPLGFAMDQMEEMEASA